MVNIKETEDGVILQVHVVPRSAKSEIAGFQGDALKLPNNGAACGGAGECGMHQVSL